MKHFTILLTCLTISVLACSTQAQLPAKFSEKQGQISTQTPAPSYPTFTATPVRLDVVGCWNVRSSPSAADNNNILRQVCDKSVYFLRWADNGFIEVFPLGDGREYICNQATNTLTELECK